MPTDDITDTDLAAYLALAEKATPGPWTTMEPDQYDGCWAVKGQALCILGMEWSTDDADKHDAAFIAASRTVGPAAARRALAAEARLEQAKSLLRKLYDMTSDDLFNAWPKVREFLEGK